MANAVKRGKTQIEIIAVFFSRRTETVVASALKSYQLLRYLAF